MTETFSQLTVKEEVEVEELCQQQGSLFDDVPRQISLTVHDVQLREDVVPCRQHPDCVVGEEGDLGEKVLDSGKKEPSQSEWSSPCELVKEKDAGWRLCMDDQRMDDKTKVDLHSISCIYYIVLCSRDWRTHIVHPRDLVDRLDQTCLTLKKSESGCTTTYVGYECVRMRECKIQAVRELPVLTSRRALRRVLGMTGYHGRFVRNYSELTQPLTQLLQMSQRYQGDSSCQAAFDGLKTVLSCKPALRTPDGQQPFSLMVDASDTTAGAVLLQAGDRRQRHPLAHCCWKFRRRQRSCSPNEREALGLVSALAHVGVCLRHASAPALVSAGRGPLASLESGWESRRLLKWSRVLPFQLNARLDELCCGLLTAVLTS